MIEGFHFEEIELHETRLYLLTYDAFDPLDHTRFLTKIELQRLLSFKNDNRRQEFVATRILRHHIFGFEHIHYDSHGAPFIESEGYISISHCQNKVGLALNRAYKIGLDLEAMRPNILDIMPKFLSEEECSTFNTENKKEVTKIWSAKEALYKLAGRKKIHFKSELLLSKQSNGNWKGQIVNPDSDIYVNLNIFEHDGIIISINKEEIVEEQRNI